MEADSILQGFVYALFSLCGASSLIYFIRMKLHERRPTLKASSSTEDLTSIEDPQETV